MNTTTSHCRSIKQVCLAFLALCLCVSLASADTPNLDKNTIQYFHDLMVATWGPEKTWTPIQRAAYRRGLITVRTGLKRNNLSDLPKPKNGLIPSTISPALAKRHAAYIVYQHRAEFARARDAAERSFGPSEAWTDAQRDKYIDVLCGMIRKFHSSDFPGELWSLDIQEDGAYFLYKGADVAHAYLISHGIRP